MAERRVSVASVAGQRAGERRGWFLKKAKTSSSWAKSHHSHRYFVALGHALSYYDGMADSPQASAALRGVIDLREVKRVRPSGARSHAHKNTKPAFHTRVVKQTRNLE